MRSPVNSRPKGRSLSSARGRNSWASSRPRALRCRRPADVHDAHTVSDETKGRPMTTGITTELLPLTARPAWKALEAHYKNVAGLHLRTLFAGDATRGERLTAEGAGLFLDYSKNRVTDDTITLLCRLAEASGLRDRIDAMFGGVRINVTENRSVLHTALRAPRGTSI